MQLKDSWMFWWRTVSYRSPDIGTPNHVKFIQVTCLQLQWTTETRSPKPLKADTQRENENLDAMHGIAFIL